MHGIAEKVINSVRLRTMTWELELEPIIGVREESLGALEFREVKSVSTISMESLSTGTLKTVAAC